MIRMYVIIELTDRRSVAAENAVELESSSVAKELVHLDKVSNHKRGQYSSAPDSQETSCGEPSN